ncbi:hypothetical protein D3C76_1580490 [compost metagenome]
MKLQHLQDRVYYISSFRCLMPKVSTGIRRVKHWQNGYWTKRSNGDSLDFVQRSSGKRYVHPLTQNETGSMGAVALV